MMSNNKVLTVAYGTFSCTLEGFDDSVGTMKVIAEYFQNLSADDRYFGAVPPQPDAEMLARIAEKEIARRVQARLDGNNLVLSAAPQAEPDAPDAAVEETPAAEAETAVAVDTAPEAEPVPEPETVAEPEPAQEPEFAPEAEVVSDPAPEEQTIAAAEQDAVIEAEDIPPAASKAALAAGAGIAGAGAAAATSSIADKLARIRAVVSQGGTDAPDYTEDQHAEEIPGGSELETFPEDEPETVAETGREEPAAAPEAEPEPEAETLPEAEVTAERPALPEAPAAVEAKAQEPAAEEPKAEMPGAKAQDPDDVSAILARLAAEEPAPEPEVEEPEPEAAMADPEPEAAMADPEPEPEPEPGPEPETKPEPEAAATEPDAKPDAPAAPAARVIKVKRADLEAAIANGQLEEVDPDAPEDIPSTLSAEDEAELMRDLAEVEAELPSPEPETAPVAETGAEPETAPEAAPEAQPAAKSPGSAPDVDRLMAKAEAEMETPEAASNREAFAQLRGAVAASKSDTGIGEELKSEEETGRYRTDLAAAIRPRRPTSSGAARDARPKTRPAPLKLVAEQRVDVPEGKAGAGPVRPRRVASAAEAGPDGSFADYAEDLGAHSLPQLLEAAAAYLAFVENRDSFSRPQIMNKVRAAQGGEFSREDGLRSFGQLLRAGKIEKLKGGRFAATGETGFRPDARAAG